MPIVANYELLKMTQLPEVRKITSLKIYIYASIKNLVIFKFGEQVNLIQKVPLGKLPHEVVMSSHNYVNLANLFISSHRGATVIKFRQ